MCIRDRLTTVFAGTLGYERERHRQAAGFRTYIIVADAAALVMMTNLYIGDVFGSTDLVRMPASVITGGTGTQWDQYYRGGGVYVLSLIHI